MTERCNNTATFYVDDRAGEPQQIKAVLHCHHEPHGDEKQCNALVANTDPQVLVSWRGTTSPKRPVSGHG